MTDANGFQLIKRKVYRNIGAVSSSFYPVTSLISCSDSKKENSLTILTDRPQAGSVHKDGGIKLLIDRRIKTNDSGGIPEKMKLDFADDLLLNFDLKFHKHGELTPADAHRNRNILAIHSDKFTF